ncbi:MAG: ATP-binding cassette domain-containing protein [Bacteroidota bacterium]
MTNILEIDGLTKHYGAIKAVDQLNLQVGKGQIYGILGPNGSGKTTTLGMIMGIIQPKAGSYSWFEGLKAQDARKKIGTLLETPNFYPFMTAVQNLKVVAHIKRVKNPKIEEHLKLVRLFGRKDYAFKTYSLGMKQRLAIAAGLIGDPEVLIFDEPTNGLDPEGIAEVRQLILQIANRGKTIIMASHILDEVEKICSHVAIIKNGVLLTDGAVDSIINAQPTIEVASADIARLKAAFTGQQGVLDLSIQADKLMVILKDDYGPAYLNELAHQKGIILNHLFLKKKSLEEEFLDITRDQNQDPKA